MDIKKIFQLASEKEASDIHIVFNQKPILRINGELFHINDIVPEINFSQVTTENLEELIDVLLSDEQKLRFLKEKDLDFAYQLADNRFRINFYFEKGNIAMAARVISNSKPTLEEIGMPTVIKELLDSSQGLILITGPTGCGKSTTLAAMINQINNSRSVNIVTLEDPIEFIFEANKSIISQRELGADMASFSSGLKHALRQDPNIIMIGEMRDLETISTAVTLAETGHLVLATLHTYSAAQTIDRIIDIFPPHQQNQIKSQLSSVLTAVISQRLLPAQKGGRVATREILIRNSAIANLIREGRIAQIKSVIETGGSVGMVTLDHHIKELYRQGKISYDVARSNIGDRRLLSGL